MDVVMNEGGVTVTRGGAVAVMLLHADRSGRVRLTPWLLEALGNAVRGLERSGDVAVAVLTGDAHEFCLGADLERLLSPAADPEPYLKIGQEVMAALAESAIPIIAAINGAAMGGGFELAMACDLRWAQPRAVFSLPEGRHRLVPAWGAVAALARQVPQAAAWELLTGHGISARRAWELGLVGRVIEGRGFLGRAVAEAGALAVPGRERLAELKALWRAAGDGGYTLLERQTCLRRIDAVRRPA